MTRIVLDHVTKIEGHAKLDVKLEDGQVKLVRLEVFEGARYFEALVKGRHFEDVSKITSRICGICSQAHSLASLQAVENALRMKVSKQTRQLRNLLHLGSLIQSHVLHLYFLAMPDYLGFDNAVAMASKHTTEVKRGLRLKRLANKICEVIGGRQIHSVTTVVGGFSKLPDEDKLNELKQELIDAREDVMRTATLFTRLRVPKFDRRTEYVCLKVPKQFSLLEGNVVSTGRLNFKPERYKQFMKEEVVSGSTAKNVTIKNNSFMVGALARMNNSREMLSHNARKALRQSRVKFPNYNPYMNNLAQAIEVVNFVDRCIAILDDLELKEEELPNVKPRQGHGVSIIEAPRGLLVHDCKLNKKGDVVDYNIIAPTTMNIRNVEDDMKELIPTIAKKPEKQIAFELEKLVRAYDPCISCSAHFLEVNWI